MCDLTKTIQQKPQHCVTVLKKERTQERVRVSHMPVEN